MAAIQVHLDREHDHRWVLLDRSWRVLSRRAEAPPRPRALEAMIEAAEVLGAEFDFVRIDLYDAIPHPRFGEMTFYPGSGLDPFDSEGVDQWLGELWRLVKSTHAGADYRPLDLRVHRPTSSIVAWFGRYP
ncbi:ATP-grasp fold amidoligase family protein [Sphingomonas sp. 1P08PE]|uniref:ATP-grasp fold amidoligase family protein n=1 Tax=Sphingomonas sp. 1P08PE TaxID=554122 RepID=UPI0039A12FEC